MGLDRRAARQTSAGYSPLGALVEKLRASHAGREGAGLQERLQAELRAAADHRHNGRPEGGNAAAEGDRGGASALIVMPPSTIWVTRVE